MRSEFIDTSARRDLAAEALEVAPRLAASGEIGRVQVVAGRRPTYPELHALRIEAERRGLEVSLTAGGCVTVQRPNLASSSPSRRSTPERHPSLRPAAVGRRLRHLGGSLSTWDAGFTGIREGTR